MRELRRRLPSAAGLIAFEAAGRHLNFSRAAEELCVSQAAVSRQIRQLEQQLGVELFQRLHRSVALTPAGTRLHQAVGFGFDHIGDAIAQLEQMSDERHVGVAANNAVAFYWLRPRATAFQQEHPDVQLAVFASDTDPALDSADIDVAIRYGGGHWPDSESVLLFEEAVFPVCSPAYAQSVAALGRAEDLLCATLLYMDPQGPDWVTWQEWLRAQGVDPKNGLSPGLMFNSYPVLLQAAIDGQGIAIGTDHLVDHLLTDGSLVRPMAEEYRTGRGYYLVLPADNVPSPATVLFRDWLRSQVRGSDACPIESFRSTRHAT